MEPPSEICGLIFRDQANVLALDGLEGGGGGGAAGLGILAGNEGYVLPDDDLGFLVIQRQQAGRRQDVGVGIGFQRARQYPQIENLANPRQVDLAAHDADIQTLADGAYAGSGVDNVGATTTLGEVGAADDAGSRLVDAAESCH